MQEAANSPNLEPQSSNGQSPQTPVQQEAREEKKDKSKLLVIIIVLLVFLIILMVAVFGFLYINSNKDEDPDRISEDNVVYEEDDGREYDEEYVEDGEQEESEEESNEPVEPDEPQAEVEDTKACIYDDGTEKISFDVPKSWSCTEVPAGAASVYSLTLESGNSGIKFQVGLVLSAPCQDPTGNCPEDMIYSSGDVDLKKITNSNPGGPDDITVSGNFYKSGTEIQNVYIDFITPDLSTTNLTEAQEQELFPILDSVSYPS